MKRILAAFLLGCLFVFVGCGSEPAEETVPAENIPETAETASAGEETVKLVSGITFSGAKRPVVVSDGRQILDPSPSREETPEAGMKIYAVNSTKAGRLCGIRDQKAGDASYAFGTEGKGLD